MTSTREEGGWGVFKFVTCVWVLLFLIDLLFIFADGGVWRHNIDHFL